MLGEKGDSIAEVLIALLISSLALVLLASMISSSANMITNSKTKMNDYYTETNVLNTFSGSVSSTTITAGITVNSGGMPVTASETYSASYYANSTFQNNPVVAFEK